MIEKNSRRRFFKSLVETSQHYIDEDNATTAVELGSEAVIGLLAVIAAIEAGKINLVSVDAIALDKYSDHQNLLHASREKLGNLGADLFELLQSLQTLSSEWRRNYRKSRTVLKSRTETHCDSNGDCTTSTEFYYDTEYYWDEPDEWKSRGLDRTSISTWENAVFLQLSTINSANDSLQNTPTFVDGFDTYRVTATPLDKTKRSLVTTVGFATAAMGFAFYEEIISALANYYGGYDSLLKNIASKRVTRRSLLKLFAGSFSIYKLKKWSEKFAAENSGIQEKIEGEIKNTIENMSLNDEEAIELLFGTNKNTITNTHINISGTLSEALDTNGNGIEDYDIIRPLLENLIDRNSNRQNSLELYTQNGNKTEISDDLKDIASHIKADKYIQNLTAEHQSQAVWNAILQVILLVAAFAGIAVTSEITLAITDEVYNNLRNN